MSDDGEPELLETLLGALVRPARTFQGLRDAPSARGGAGAVALTAMGWGGLSLLLWAAGREARFVLVPLSGHDYYLVQGVVMLPLLTILWWVFAAVAHAVASRLGGQGPRPGTLTALGFAYALPLGLHVGAELVAYLFFGFEALARVARVSMPLAALWVAALSVVALKVLHGLSAPRATAAALVGLLAQLALGAPLLR